MKVIRIGRLSKNQMHFEFLSLKDIKKLSFQEQESGLKVEIEHKQRGLVVLKSRSHAHSNAAILKGRWNKFKDSEELFFDLAWMELEGAI